MHYVIKSLNPDDTDIHDEPIPKGSAYVSNIIFYPNEGAFYPEFDTKEYAAKFETPEFAHGACVAIALEGDSWQKHYKVIKVDDGSVWEDLEGGRLCVTSPGLDPWTATAK